MTREEKNKGGHILFTGGDSMKKLALMVGFGAGVMTAVLAGVRMKHSVLDRGRKMLKDKIIKILD